MDRLGRLLIWAALLAVVAFSAWLVAQSEGFRVGLPAPQVLDLAPQLTPTIYPSALTVIHGIQELSRLETAVYHIEKIITAESGQGPLGFLFGDKLLLIAHGLVIAGVDLGDIGPVDVWVGDQGEVILRLPAAQVFVATLDNQRTQVYDRRTGVIGMNPQLETDARREAERLILEAALENGLKQTAEENARTVLRSFLLSLGFEQVVFASEVPASTPASVATVAAP